MSTKTAFSALIILIFLIPGISSEENPDMKKARKARDLAEQAIVEGRFCEAAIELVAVYDYAKTGMLFSMQQWQRKGRGILNLQFYYLRNLPRNLHCRLKDL